MTCIRNCEVTEIVPPAARGFTANKAYPAIAASDLPNLQFLLPNDKGEFTWVELGSVAFKRVN